ncbi:helix-turn-helix domain-containing protein [Paenibacillus humicola]|uniref:helix-turn-helix domain-containing protein n=1 Tax=Paenibacillus humicola TaxID=3110540 RepID=UPI00237B8762|nr:helix-turn-helix domain-containing protein [Paenibacillus humicola]
MKMNWYCRMLLSYTPIFLVVGSSVIFVLFTVLNNDSESRSSGTNRTIAEQVMRNTDANLKLIERSVVSELAKDQAIRDFFSGQPTTVYDDYVTQKNLVDMQSLFPFVNSVYLYNASKQRVLTETGVYPIESFADKPFLLSAYKHPADGWTNPRVYAQSPFDKSGQKVVSLALYVPYAAMKQGAVVVNIYARSLEQYLGTFADSGTGTIHLLDSSKTAFDTGAMTDRLPQLFAQSPYTGWYFYDDSVHAMPFHRLSFLSNAWVVVMLAMIGLAIAGSTVITHMHYKPIKAIFGKASGYMARKSEELRLIRPRNELAFIETALDHLLKKSLDYHNLRKENRLLRQQRLFQDLLAGHRILSEAEWEKEMAALNLPYRFDRLGVAALEIDHYRTFTKTYKPGDQRLLKFILESAFRELAQQRDLFVWHAWLKPCQIVFIVHLFKTDTSTGAEMRELCEDFRTWVNHHLQLTVTAGIGAESDAVDTLVESCRSAQENVSCKAVFGTDTVIDNRLRQAKASGDADFVDFQAIRELAQAFRMDDRLWKEKLTRMFEAMNDTLMTKRAMAEFIRGVTRQLGKEISVLSADIRFLWMDQYQYRFEELADDTETLAELSERLTALMGKLEDELKRERVSRKHHSVALQVKQYIDEHYADPKLSLLHVSGRFGLQPATLSHLFKEELGEKFIDYVLKLRFGHARRLLVESDEPIQSIAEKVGYNHAISFHRAFKKMYDLPPGEYRSLHRPGQLTPVSSEKMKANMKG